MKLIFFATLLVVGLLGIGSSQIKNPFHLIVVKNDQSAHHNADAEVRVLSAVGMRQVMLDLGPKFKRATGRKEWALSFRDWPR